MVRGRQRIGCGRTLAAALGLLALAACEPRPAAPGGATPSTLHLYSASIRGFDPAKVNDLASGLCIMRVYETLLQHSYLNRPFALEPLLCEAMPEVSPDGLAYTFRLRSGIFFQDDPCFRATGGRGREATAEDFVYSLKRIADLKNASVAWWIVDGKIKGLDAFREASGGPAPTDYDAPVEGLRAVDARTIRIELTAPYAQLLWVLAMHHCVLVPREAVEFYGAQFTAHPVGTGPYRLARWRRNYSVEVVRNPGWVEHGRVDRYPSHGAPGDEAAGLLADAGQPLPLNDRVITYFVSDPATQWLMFMRGELDESLIARDNWNLVLDAERRLLPDLAQKGLRLFAGPEVAVGYIGFNMDDPLVGTNRALRQAMQCAFDHEQWIKLNNYRIKKPTGPVPHSVPGYIEEPLRYDYDPARAKRLLAEAGYPEGRDPKTGRRLELTVDVGSAESVEVRQSIELFISFMEKIGVVVRASYNNWPTFMEKLEHRQVQLYYLRWLADYPDAQNFLLLFYSKSASPGPNHSNYVNPAFDAIYEKALTLPDSPERTELYRRMGEIVREECPWIIHTDNMVFVLRQAWVKNYKFHPLATGVEKYCRVDEAERARAREGR